MVNYEKVYVAMLLRIDDEGFMKPVAVEWTDGMRFDIDKIIDERNAPPEHTGGVLTRKYKVWTLPVEDLLYVGKATQQKLNRIGIKTIGDLAQAEEQTLVNLLGKWGCYLHTFANGKDESPVTKIGEEEAIKSIGNSLTVYRDLVDDDDVEPVIYLLADSISSRMREAGLNKARTVHVYARANNLIGYQRQGKLTRPSGTMQVVAKTAFKLFKEVYPWEKPVRSLGISVSDFLFGNEQLDLFGDLVKDEKQKRLDAAIDKLRAKYGNNVIQAAIVYKDTKLKDLDIKGEHTIHPYSFFKNNK